MKILHIFSGDGGGVATYIKNLIKEKDKEIAFYLLSFTEYGEEFIALKKKHNNVYLFTMPRPKIVGYKTFLLYMISFFRNNKFDFIDSHFAGHWAIIFRILSYLTGSKNFLIHVHQTSIFYDRKLTKIDKLKVLLFPKINNILSTNNIACGVDAAKFGFGKHYKDRTFIIYNSIDTEKFYNNYHKNYNKEKTTVAHIGTHTSAKNLMFIINLAEFIKKMDLNIEIWMFGDGELSIKFKNSVAEKQLDQIIRLFGRKQNIENFFPEIDTIILPSFSEGLPTVVIESQATGTPIILSDTITDEVDLELGMLKYLPINNQEQNYQRWIDEILIFKDARIPELKTINEAIDKKKFTTEQMYNSFIEMVEKVVHNSGNNRA